MDLRKKYWHFHLSSPNNGKKILDKKKNNDNEEKIAMAIMFHTPPYYWRHSVSNNLINLVNKAKTCVVKWQN